MLCCLFDTVKRYVCVDLHHMLQSFIFNEEPLNLQASDEYNQLR